MASKEYLKFSENFRKNGYKKAYSEPLFKETQEPLYQNQTSEYANLYQNRADQQNYNNQVADAVQNANYTPPINNLTFKKPSAPQLAARPETQPVDFNTAKYAEFGKPDVFTMDNLKRGYEKYKPIVDAIPLVKGALSAMEIADKAGNVQFKNTWDNGSIITPNEVLDRPTQAAKAYAQAYLEPIYNDPSLSTIANIWNPKNVVGNYDAARRGLMGQTKTEGLQALLPDATAKSFSENYPKLSAAGNFVADAALDPMNLVGWGAGKALGKIAPKALKSLSSLGDKAAEAFRVSRLDEVGKLKNKYSWLNENSKVAPKPVPKPETIPDIVPEHLRTQEAFDKAYGLDTPYSLAASENLVDAVGKRVIRHTGTNDLVKILDFYKEKYKLPDIELTAKVKKDSVWGSTDPKYKPNNLGLESAKININPNLSREKAVGALRHEIEHVRDLMSGYKGKPEANIKPMAGESTRAFNERQRAGHNKDMGWFEAEYLRKSLIEDAKIKPSENPLNKLNPEYVKPSIKKLFNPDSLRGTNPVTQGSMITEQVPVAKAEMPRIDPNIKVKDRVIPPNQMPSIETDPAARIAQIKDQLAKGVEDNKDFTITRGLKDELAMLEKQTATKPLPKTASGKIGGNAKAVLDNARKPQAPSVGEFKNPSVRSGKAEGMRTSAEKRAAIQGESTSLVDGGLTEKELKAKIKHDASNYTGKKVMTPEGEAIALGQNAFGNVKVKLADGTIKSFKSADVKSLEVKTGDAIWKNKDVDQPVKVTGSAGEYNGKQYVNIEGSKTAIPVDEITYRPESTPISKENIPNAVKEYVPENRPKLKETGALEESKGSKSLRADLNMEETIRRSFEADPHLKRTLANPTTRAAAQERFDKGYEAALKDFESVTKPRTDDVPLAYMLANEATRRGDIPKAREIINTVLDRLTEAGRYVQANKILRRTDPEFILQSLESRIRKFNKEGVMLKGDKWKEVKLSDVTAGEILNLEMYNEKAAEAVMKKAYQEIYDQVPVSNWDKFDTLRRTAMLFNPKTHIRNMVGNRLMRYTSKVSDSLATAFEKTLPQDQRTKALRWKDDAARVEKVNQSWLENKDNFTGSGKYDLDQLKINNVDRKIFDNKFLEKLNTTSKGWLEAQDMRALKHAYQEALGGFMKARGLKDVSEEAVQYAFRRAEEATFRQANSFASWVNKAKRGQAGKMGLLGKGLDAVMPFVKTPSNIMATGFDYSPMGLIKVLAERAMGKRTGADFIEKLAQGATGTVALAGAMYLTNLGMLRGAATKSKKLEDIQQGEGEAPNSVITPWGSWTIDWAQPIAFPLVMGIAAMEAMDKKNQNPNDILDMIINMPVAAGDSFLNNSMLKGVKDLLGGNGSIAEKLLGLPIDYVEQALFPTLGGQVARAVDDTKRDTYDTTKSGMFFNQLKAKVPFASKTLEPKLDVYGEPIKQNDPVSQFANPAYYAVDKNNPVSEEVMRLYKLNKNTGVLPQVAPKEFTQNKDTVVLSPKEKNQFQRTMGQGNLKDISTLLGSERYKMLSDAEKEVALARVVSDNYDKAKNEILKMKNKLPTKQEKAKQNANDKKLDAKIDNVLKILK